jgi:hypothetical protein
VKGWAVEELTIFLVRVNRLLAAWWKRIRQTVKSPVPWLKSVREDALSEGLPPLLTRHCPAHIYKLTEWGRLGPLRTKWAQADPEAEVSPQW